MLHATGFTLEEQLQYAVKETKDKHGGLQWGSDISYCQP